MEDNKIYPTPDWFYFSQIRQKEPEWRWRLSHLCQELTGLRTAAASLHQRNRDYDSKSQIREKRWAKITNLYCRPSRSHTAQSTLALPVLPNSPDCLILGDLNAHHNMWDEFQPIDTREEETLDWCLENDLHVMNDGSHTRNNIHSTARQTPDSEGKSSPDVSICGSTWSRGYTWITTVPIGSSDHLPILITLDEAVSHQSIFKGIPRWKNTGVDWGAYTEQLEKVVEEFPSTTNVHTLSKLLEAEIISAAKRHIGTTVPGKHRKPWMTPPVREAIRNTHLILKQL